MTPLQPQKKRSAGRPKENKLLRELKVKTWFNAVAEASGKTAYQLEKEFSPSYVDKDKFHKQRSRLWEKYRTGKIVPTMKETKGGRRPIALMVEEKYPGTLQWLTSPIWTLADPESELTMNDFKVIYKSLRPEIRDLLIEDNLCINNVFWRKSTFDTYDLMLRIVNVGGLDCSVAFLALLREAIVCQRKDIYKAIIDFIELINKYQKYLKYELDYNQLRTLLKIQLYG